MINPSDQIINQRLHAYSQQGSCNEERAKKNKSIYPGNDKIH